MADGLQASRHSAVKALFIVNNKRQIERIHEKDYFI